MGVKFGRQFRGYRRKAVEAYEAELMQEFRQEIDDLHRELEYEREATQRLAEQLAAREAELRDAALRGTQSLRQALQSPYDTVQTLQDAMQRQLEKRQQLQATLQQRRDALAAVRRLQANLAAALRTTGEQFAEALAAEQAQWEAAE